MLLVKKHYKTKRRPGGAPLGLPLPSGGERESPSKSPESMKILCDNNRISPKQIIVFGGA
jgi:hypothetical protein